MPPRPRITIETYLGKIPKSNVDTVATQLTGLDKRLKSGGKQAESFSKRIDRLIASTHGMSTALKVGNRDLAVQAARLAISQHRIRNVAHAMDAAKTIFRDMFSAVGFLNNALSIMVSRFGTMILLFGAIQQIRKLSQAMKEAALEMDTNFNRVASIVVSNTTSIGKAMEELSFRTISYATKSAASFDQISNTMFFLASAGRSAEQIMTEFADAQNLVIATSKDLVATQEELKVAVEVFSSLMNVYGESISNIGKEAVTAKRLSELMFEAFKTQQILLSEFAIGLQYAGTQAKLMDISIEELIASIAVLNTGMLKGSKAGTGYANALRDATQKAGKLEQVFGISVKNIGKDFSFLETVVKGIRDRIDETGVTLELMQELFQVFNIRGARAVLTLAVQYDRAIKLLKDFEGAEGDLAVALDKVTNSLKGQEVRYDNIKNVALVMFEQVITGGLGFGKVLRLINDDMELLLRPMAVASAFALGLGVTLAGMALIVRQLARMIIQLGMSMAALEKANPISKIIEEWKEWGRTVKDTYKWFDLLLQYAAGYEGEFNEILAERRAMSEEGQRDAIRLSDAAIESLLKYHSMLIKVIEDQERIFSKRGTELKFNFNTDLVYDEYLMQFEIIKQKILESDLWIEIPLGTSMSDEEFKRVINRLEQFAEGVDKINDPLISLSILAQGNLEIIHRYLKKYNEDIEDMFTILKFSEGSMEGFTKMINNLLYPGKKEDTAAALIEGLRERLRKFVIEARSAGISSIEDLVGLSVRDRATFLNKYVLILEEYFSKTRELHNKEGDQRVRDMIDTHNRMLKEEKTYFNNRKVLINEQRYEDFIKSGGRLDQVMSISFLPAISEQATKQLEVLNVETMDRINQTMADLLKVNFQKRIQQTSNFGGELINLEGKTAREIVRIWIERYGEIDQFTKHERNLLQQMIKDQEAKIKEIIKADLSAEERNLLSQAAQAAKIIDDEFREIKRLETLIPSPEIDARIKEIERHITTLTDEKYRDLILGQKRVNAEIERLTQDVIRKWLLGLGLTIDQVNDLMNKLTENASEMLDTMKRKFEDTAIIANNFSSILTDISDLMSDESGTKKMIASLAAISKAVSQITQEIGSMYKTWKLGELSMISIVGGATGILGAITAAISAIAAMRLEPKFSPLQEEFLSPEQAGRLTPDYGQARVINNNNSLATSFQFLDVSQLTPHTQRQIAEGFVDELVEILKSRGDI